MDHLAETVKIEVFKYVGGGTNLRIFGLTNESDHIYAVNMVEYGVNPRPARVVIMARIDGDKVIIEQDITDRPLVDALMRAGIPREQIVLAYAGEPLPEAIEAK